MRVTVVKKDDGKEGKDNTKKKNAKRKKNKRPQMN